MDSELISPELDKNLTEKLNNELDKLPASGLILQLRPASSLLWIYVCFFSLILLSVLILPVDLWQKISILLILCAFFQLILRKDLLLKHPKSIQKLVLTELHWCFIQFNNDQLVKATILSNTLLTEHLVILNLQNRSLKSLFFKQYSIVITAESIGKDNFRKLKRYLRFM